MSLSFLYLLGTSSKQGDDAKITIVTLNVDSEDRGIGISYGWSAHDPGSVHTAAYWLERCPSKWKLVGREYVEFVEPPGWFERTCVEANCEWFVPIAKHIAAGENIPMEEIQLAYRKHNGGKEMPCGTWGTLHNVWLKMQWRGSTLET